MKLCIQSPVPLFLLLLFSVRVSNVVDRLTSRSRSKTIVKLHQVAIESNGYRTTPAQNRYQFRTVRRGVGRNVTGNVRLRNADWHISRGS